MLTFRRLPACCGDRTAVTFSLMGDLRWGNILTGAGLLLLGGTQFYSGIKGGEPNKNKALGGAEPKRLWDADPAATAQLVFNKIKNERTSMLRDPNQPAVAKEMDLDPIEDRVAVIGRLIKKYSRLPEIREEAISIVAKRCGDKWCIKEKDWDNEVRAVFDYVRQRVRYVRDHYSVDQFSGPDRTLAVGAGDCDDYSIVLGSLLMAIGNRVKLRVVQADGGASFNHIYILANPDSSGRKWTPLDASVDAPAGWEVPGAATCARTKKPSGRVQRVKDFAV